ncbi:MAG: galactokinase [Candidatus Marinimicrobia bacterium]|nr:galactokinase [Candidatus Neomarinimicrobiota bacterium]MCF7902552.1 galactokinase [Candidatus Neomarinimicrobiota bacterium]
MSLPPLVSATRQIFKKMFGGPPVIMAHAPGRLNICGEHTDYNGGLALPLAIDRHAVVAVKPADSSRIRAYAMAFDEQIEWMPGHAPEDLPPWASYINGAVTQFQEDFGLKGGIDIVVNSDLSIGSGLGSSAAFGVSIALALQILSPRKIKVADLPAYCQQMENSYMMVETGVLDQTIAIFARKNYALRIDFTSGTRTLEPLRCKNCQFVVMESTESRQLATSGYNERVAWCQSALIKSRKILRDQIRNLSGIKSSQLAHLKSGLTPHELSIVRHVVTENERVDICARALVKGDMTTLGTALNEAHASMRDDLEASTERLDFLVETAQSQTGCLGARLVGGGFGGSCFALLESDQVESFIAVMSSAYEKKFATGLPIYPVASDDAASVWRVYD